MNQLTVRVIGAGVAVDSPAMFPSALRTPSGLVVAYSTVPDGWPGGTIGVRRSRDGATWEEARIVAEPALGEDAALGALGLSRLRSGRLLLPYNAVTWQPGQGIEDCILGLRLLESNDDGVTWSGPVAVDIDFDRPAVYGEMIELADGELLWPIWGERRKGERWRSALLSSRDGGRRWRVKSTIAFDPDARMTGQYVEAGDTGASGTDIADFSRNHAPDFRPHNATDGFNETSVARLADGRLLAILRQQGVARDHELTLYTATSEDAGASWSPYERIGFPGTSPALFRTTGGQVLLGTRRFGLGESFEPAVEVRIGAADGKTWSVPVPLVDPYGTKLTAEYQCGYPSFVEEAGGTCLVFFYSHRPDVGRFVAWNRIEITPAPADQP